MSRIASVEPMPIRIDKDTPYLGPSASAGTERYYRRAEYRVLYSRYFESLLLKIVTDDGVVGWGECLAPVAAEAVATLISDLLAPVLRGRDPLERTVLWAELYDLMRDRGHDGGFMLDAITAVDIALWDAAGKLSGLSVAQLLGGPAAASVPCYVSGLVGADDEQRLAYAAPFRDAGFSAFKHAGGFGVTDDVATMRRLRAELGADVELMLDAHWRYRESEALRLGRHLDGEQLSFLEAPMAPEDVAGHARLAQALDVPIAAGEGHRTRLQFLPWLQAHAIDVLQPDVGRAGIGETARIAAMAEAFHVPVAPHLSVTLGPVVAATVHLAAAMPNALLVEYQPSVLALSNQILRDPISVAGGCYQLAGRPGLGIEVDERRVTALQQ